MTSGGRETRFTLPSVAAESAAPPSAVAAPSRPPPPGLIQPRIWSQRDFTSSPRNVTRFRVIIGAAAFLKMEPEAPPGVPELLLALGRLVSDAVRDMTICSGFRSNVTTAGGIIDCSEARAITGTL